MTDTPEAMPPATADEIRQDPVRCPHCEEITMPNLLADGSTVCSCTAERPLPVADAEPAGGPVPPTEASMDAAGFDPGGDRRRLPADRGQFGRNLGTEDYAPLRDPPV